MDSHAFDSSRRAVTWLTAAVLLTLPFVRVHGESAVRFDIPSLKLYFFGTVIWADEKYFFLLVFLLFLSGVALFTVLFGRAWCGWVCPRPGLSHISEIIDRLSGPPGSNRPARNGPARTLLAVLALVVAANFIWYFVPPWQMAADLFLLTIGPWTLVSWLFLTVLIYLDILSVRQRSCAATCPYATIADAVVTERPRRPRLRVVASSSAFAFMAVLFAYELYVRVPLDFWVTRDDPQPYAQAGEKDDSINAYSLTVENRSLNPEVFHLRIAGIKDAELIMDQNPFILRPNSQVTMRVFVHAFKKNLTFRDTQLRFILENVASREIRLEQEAVFMYPARTEQGLEI